MLAILCATYKNKAFFFLVAAVGMIGIEDIVNPEKEVEDTSRHSQKRKAPTANKQIKL